MKLQKLHFAIALSAMLMSGGHIYADDMLVVSGSDGRLSNVSVADITQITFNGDNMTIATVNGNVDYQLSSVESLTFDLATSAVDEIETSLSEDVTLNVKGGVLSVTAPADVPLLVAVYNIKGILVATQADKESVSIDFNNMAPGVYIVKANNKTIKFTL